MNLFKECLEITFLLRFYFVFRNHQVTASRFDLGILTRRESALKKKNSSKEKLQTHFKAQSTKGPNEIAHFIVPTKERVKDRSLIC